MNNEISSYYRHQNTHYCYYYSLKIDIWKDIYIYIIRYFFNHLSMLSVITKILDQWPLQKTWIPTQFIMPMLTLLCFWVDEWLHRWIQQMVNFGTTLVQWQMFFLASARGKCQRRQGRTILFFRCINWYNDKNLFM